MPERETSERGRFAALRRLHRDERGDLFDYALVFAFIAIPLLLLVERLFTILSDYFAMIAYYVTWPFI